MSNSINNNALQQFYRKPHFSITLPSRGKWYADDAIEAKGGKVQIYSMTAADDTRFKSTEAFLSDVATYALIRSCVPAIKKPEAIPTVDLDAILLSIRRASYGDVYTTKANVPNTDEEISLDLSIEKLVNDLPNAAEIWDDTLTITNEHDQKLKLTIAPVKLDTMFTATKQIVQQQQKTQEISTKNVSAFDKITEIDNQMCSLGKISVAVLANSITCLETENFKTSRPEEIKQFVANIDVAYYQAIRDHIDEQKKKLTFANQTITSTPQQIEAGAPETWSFPVDIDIASIFAR